MFILILSACTKVEQTLPLACSDVPVSVLDATPWGPTLQDYIDDATEQRDFQVTWEVDLVGAGATSFSVTVTAVDTTQLSFTTCEDPDQSRFVLPGVFDYSATSDELSVSHTGVAGDFIVVGGENGFSVGGMEDLPVAWEDAALAELQATDPEATLPQQLYASFYRGAEWFAATRYSLSSAGEDYGEGEGFASLASGQSALSP